MHRQHVPLPAGQHPARIKPTGLQQPIFYGLIKLLPLDHLPQADEASAASAAGVPPAVGSLHELGLFVVDDLLDGFH